MTARAALALLVLSSLWARVAWAGDPARVWETLSTKHFLIHFHVEERRLAERLAVVAEAAHDKLVPLLDHEPKHKTYLLLTDNTDDANGSATVLPYPTVTLFATAPDDRSELNDYDDWLSALVTHEYTHIVHLDTVHSIARIINAILGFGEWGQLYAPNQSQPRFIIEGLAVFEETERTSGGRLRSTIYDMWLRMASLEGKFQRIDQFSNYPIQWPRGAAAYLYGSAFLRFISSLYGADVLRKMSHEYGGSWLPGGINRALRRVTGGRSKGETFETLYTRFRDGMAQRYRAQLAAVEESGRIEGNVLVPPREYAARPIFSRDGRSIIWADSSGYDRQQFRAIDLDWKKGGGAPRTFFEVDANAGSTLSLDGKTLYFSAEEVHRSEYYYYDLFAVDLRTGEKRQLTHGRRADSPDLSPDGRTLAFTVNDASSRSLCLMPADGGDDDVRFLVGNRDDLSQIYTPAWSPDGQTIAFSWWRAGGFRDIWTVDVKTRQLTRVTADRALDLDPRYSPDGRFLYFSSDRTGIYNLYAYELKTGLTFQVTNVIGGAFDVAISPDGQTAAFVGFVADGWNLQTIALDPARFRPAPEPPHDRPEADVPEGSASLPTKPYQPWRTMYPHTLSLNSYPDSFGQVVSVGVGGGDLVGWHAWNLGASFSLARADDIGASFNYSYNRYFTSFSLSGYRALARRGGLYIDGVNTAYTEEDWSLSAAADLPIVRRIDRSSDLSFNYNLVWLRNLDEKSIPLDPNLITPQKPETGRVASLGVSWSWSNVRRFTYSVSPELGRAMSVNLGASLKGLGSEYEAFTASWRYSEFLPIPWPAKWAGGAFRSHVLALYYSGGLSGGEFKRRSTFYLGGYSVGAQDVVRSLFDFTRAGSASLRGYNYASISGNEYHLFNFEYRFPIAWIERSVGSFPLYLRRLHGAVFADVGDAFSDGWKTTTPRDFKVGVGAEVRLELNVFWYLGAALQLGYARGLMKDGIDEWYFLLNNPF